MLRPRALRPRALRHRWWAALLAVAVLWAPLVPPAPPARAAPLGDLVPGDTIAYFADPLLGAQRVTDHVQRGGPTLLFSDAPEQVPGPGILYQDSVSGAFRVFFDHVNATRSRPLVFTVLLGNRGALPVMVSLGRIGVAGPSRDVLQNGQAAQYAWMGPQAGGRLVVAPGRTVFLDARLNRRQALPGQNVTGILDATASGPLQVSVVAERRPVASLRGLAVLPAAPSSTGFIARGTFPHADLNLWAQGDGGLQYVRIATPRSYLQGFSAVDGRPTEDYGNYGVFYSMHIAVLTGEAESLAAVFDPQGGSFAGAALVGTGASPPLVENLPAGGGFSPGPDAGILLTRGGVLPGVSWRFHLAWMPPSGSSLPASLLLAPGA